MYSNKDAPHERVEQRALVRWIRYQPKIRDFVVKLDNEGKRTLIQGHQIKLMGLCPGASDLFIAYPTKRYHGLWIEVKRNKKYCKSEMERTSWISQLKFLALMRSVGFAAHMAYGWEHGVEIIETYLSDLTVVA